MPSLHLAKDLAKRFEGLRLEPYRDAGGLWTVGYGHLLSRDKTLPGGHFKPIGLDEAEAYLEADMAKAGAAIQRLIIAPLTENQYSALADFVFNLGAGSLQVSTLRKKVNRGEPVADEFSKWVYCGPVKLAGLVRRRAAEAALYGA